MNYVTNQIHQDEFNQYTICKMQIACKFINMLKIEYFARKKESTVALHANH